MTPPVTFHGASIDLGPRCVPECASCARDGRPALDARWVDHLCRELASIADSFPLRFAGLIAPDALAVPELLAPLASGLAAHLFDVRAVTCGLAWPRLGRDGLSSLRKAGLSGLALRIQPSHAGAPEAVLVDLVDAAHAVGLACDVIVEVAPGTAPPLDLLGSSAFNSQTALVAFDGARAARQPGADPRLLPLRGLPPRSPCRPRLRLQLLAQGEVFPCAPGARSPALRLGDWQREPLREIIGRAQEDAHLRALASDGPRALAARAPASLERPYHDACHACERLHEGERERA